MTYHSLKEINHLVAEEHLPGRAEKRPTIETNIRVAQGSGLRLSDLMQTAHAQTEVTVLPVVVVIVGSSNSSGSSGGVSHATWYSVQNAYGNGYDDGFQSGYQAGSNTSNQEEESWWNSWGKCATGSILTGVGVGFGAVVTGASFGTLSPVGVGIILGTIGGTSAWLISC